MTKQTKKELTSREISNKNLKTKGQFKNKKIASAAGKKGVQVQRKKKKITEYMLMLLEKEMEIQTKDGNKITATGAEHIATVLLKKALAGDVRALKEYLDRMEGQAKQVIEMEDKSKVDKLEVVFVSSKKK